MFRKIEVVVEVFRGVEVVVVREGEIVMNDTIIGVVAVFVIEQGLDCVACGLQRAMPREERMRWKTYIEGSMMMLKERRLW